MDAIIFTLAIVGGLVVVRAVASFFKPRARMRDQMRSAPRGEIIRDPNDDRRFFITSNVMSDRDAVIGLIRRDRLRLRTSEPVAGTHAGQQGQTQERA